MSKLRNIRTEYNGVVYQSAKEARYAAELDLRVKAGEIREWHRQVQMPLIVNRQRICIYKIDFVEVWPDGKCLYVEIKGYETPLWKLKWALFEALYPDLHKLVIK